MRDNLFNDIVALPNITFSLFLQFTVAAIGLILGFISFFGLLIQKNESENICKAVSPNFIICSYNIILSSILYNFISLQNHILLDSIIHKFQSKDVAKINIANADVNSADSATNANKINEIIKAINDLEDPDCTEDWW